MSLLFLGSSPDPIRNMHFSPEHRSSADLPARPEASKSGTWSFTWNLPDRGATPSSEEFAKLLKLPHEKIIQGVIDCMDTAGCPVDMGEHLKLGISLAEWLNNALLHGILEIKNRSDFSGLDALSGEPLSAALEKLKVDRNPRQITVEVVATSDQLTVSILDGGKMTPELFAQIHDARTKLIREFDEISKKMDAGLELNPEEETIYQRVANSTDGRGFSLSPLFFSETRGLHGGVVLTRFFEK